MGDDLFRSYYVSKEAWYSASLGERDDEVMVALSSTSGGVKWEFGFRLHSIGTLRAELFSDSWEAFSDCPDLFAALAEMGDGASLVEVRDLLNSLGFRDTTERETPARYAR